MINKTIVIIILSVILVASKCSKGGIYNYYKPAEDEYMSKSQLTDKQKKKNKIEKENKKRI